MSPPTMNKRCHATPPTIVNVCKSARDQEGYKSFGEWYDGENNIYIGRNASKYAHRPVQESKWSNPFLCCDWDASKSDWVVEDLMQCYEKYVRKNPKLMNSLHELEGKQLGCWCKPGSCHGDVLLKIFVEMNENNEQVTKKSK